MKFKNTIFEKLFKKKNEIKVIQEPRTIEVKEQDKSKFKDTLKIKEVKKQKKKEVRTLTCIGDGLGIQGKINS